MFSWKVKRSVISVQQKKNNKTLSSSVTSWISPEIRVTGAENDRKITRKKFYSEIKEYEEWIVALHLPPSPLFSLWGLLINATDRKHRSALTHCVTVLLWFIDP